MHFPYESMGTQVQMEAIKGATKYHGLSFILPKRCEAQQVLLLLFPFSKLLKEEDTRNDGGRSQRSLQRLGCQSLGF